MLKEKIDQIGKIRINYAYTDDDAPALVLLHGTANRWQAFLPLIPALATRWKIFAPDFRGHGSSEHTGVYGFGYYLADTVSFLEEVVGEKAVIFGHSLGGRIATKIASDYSELVRAIILGDSSLKDPEPSERMGKVLGDLIKILEDQRTVSGIFQSLREAGGSDFDAVSGLTRAKSLSQLDPELPRSIIEYGMDLSATSNHFHGYKPETHIHNIKCPVLILHAEHGMLSDSEVKKALNILPEAYNVVLEGVPHEFLSKPTLHLMNALHAFLELVRD
jgi:pimeloyl-ACP methyl ester carboxylesterase